MGASSLNELAPLNLMILVKKVVKKVEGENPRFFMHKNS